MPGENTNDRNSDPSTPVPSAAAALDAASNRNSSAPPPPQPQISQAELNRIVLVYLNKKGYHRTELMLRIESTNSPTAAPPLASPSSTALAGPAEISTPLLPPNATRREKEARDKMLLLERELQELRDKQSRLEYELSMTRDSDARALKERELRGLHDLQDRKQRESDPDIYIAAYSMLRNWVDTSLELYRPELTRLLYPIFVHCFLELVSKRFTSQAKDFFLKFKHDHSTLHGQEISRLAAISLPEHLKENDLANTYRNNRYKIKVSKTTMFLLLYFLQEHEAVGGAIIIRIINQYLTPIVSSTKPGEINREGEANPEEGIVQLPSEETQVSKFNEQPVKLGKLPLDPEVQREIEAELKVKDENTPPVNGVSLLSEFESMTKPSLDAPPRELVPLPVMDATDIKRMILDVQDSRSKIRLDSIQPSAPSVCMYTFHNTNNDMTCLDFNRDSNMVAAGFHDSYVKLWSLDGNPLKSVFKRDRDNSQTSRKLIGHLGPVYGVSFSPDNKFLISGLEDKTARLWLLDSYSALVSYKGHNQPIWDVKFSPLGHYFATASHDQTARLWATDHIYPLRIFAGHISDVDCVDFHPNSNYVFTGSSDKTCRMWDVQTGNCVRVFMGHTGPVNCLAVSPDGRWLASAGEDSVVNLWDCGTGRKLKTMKGHGRSLIYSLAFSRDGAVLVSGGADCSVRVWDVKQHTNDAAPEPEPFAVGKSGDHSGLIDLESPADLNGLQNGHAGHNSRSNNSEKHVGREIIASSDHMTAFFTKQTPVYKVHFTRRNLCLAGGAFMG